MKYNRSFARRQWRNLLAGSIDWRISRQHGRIMSFRNFLKTMSSEDIDAAHNPSPAVDNKQS